MAKTWFITGAARGLGAEIAKSALAAGDNVVATARKATDVSKAFPDGHARLLALSLDITDPKAVAQAVAAALAEYDRIDILVNNAGYSQLGLFEESSDEDVQRQFDTNVFGLMRVTRAVLPAMRKQRFGHIINFSSVGGVVPFELCSLYGASKFAVEGFSANLSRELKSFGIHVTILEPGFFRTDFLDPSSARFSGSPIEDYDDVRARAEAQYKEQNPKQLGDPATLGKALLKIAGAATPPPRLVLGSDALELIRKELHSRFAALDEWSVLTLSTDHSAAQ
jgi:NAD(P)-dependent dehydrogenase (short-subunit alcohol dehydrogenase family)